MTTAIISALASIIGWAALKGADLILGKWIAYIVVAWDANASEKARAAYQETMAKLKLERTNNYSQREDWRKQAQQKTSALPNEGSDGPSSPPQT